MKYQTQSTYNYKKQRYTKPSGKSMTVPDQSYTIRQIMDKFTTGQPINNTGQYMDFDYGKGQKFEREHFQDFKRNVQAMDLTEQKTEIIAASAEIEKINSRKNFKKNHGTTKEPDNTGTQTTTPAGGEK